MTRGVGSAIPARLIEQKGAGHALNEIRHENEMKQVIGVKATVVWRYFQDRKSENWIGICDHLKLTVEAENPPELHEAMTEAMDLFLNEMLSSGDLRKFLREHGWSLTTAIPEPKKQRQDIVFDVPLQTRRIPQRDLDKVCC